MRVLLVDALDRARKGIPPFSPGLEAKLLDEFTRVTSATDPAPPPDPVHGDSRRAR